MMRSRIYRISKIFGGLFLCGVAGLLFLGGTVHLSLKNANFEEGLSAWSGSERFGPALAVDTSGGRDGKKCLRIEMAGGTQLPCVYQRLVHLEVGATYRLSAWAKGVSGKEVALLKLMLEFYNLKGERCSGHPMVQRLESGVPWTECSVSAYADPDAMWVDVIVGAAGAGVLKVDGVRFEKVAEPPELRAVSASGPVAVAPDRPSTLLMKAFLKTPLRGAERDSPPFEVMINDRLKLPAAKVIRIDERNFEVKSTLPPLEPGLHQVRLSCGKHIAGEAVVVSVPPRARKPERLDEEGTLTWQGKPFFPIGIYNVNHTEAEYAALAAQGFNMVQGKFPGNPEEFTHSLDMALRHGIAVDVPLYVGNKVKENLGASLRLLKSAGNHPAVLCWKIIDEPDADQNVAIRGEVSKAYAVLKAAQPKQPLELTLSQDDTLGFWSHFCDTVQADRYPLPGGSIAEIYDACVKARAAMLPWQNLTCVLQCGWTPDLKTQPTFRQARAMVYLALIGGAKGISWYSRQDPGWDLTGSPLWPHLKTINAEIGSLAKPLMLGTEVGPIRCNLSGVRLKAMIYEGRLYLLVCNPGEAPAKARIELPVPSDGPEWDSPKIAGSAGSAGQQKLTMQGRNIQVNLAGVEACTIVFNAANPGKKEAAPLAKAKGGAGL